MNAHWLTLSGGWKINSLLFPLPGERRRGTSGEGRDYREVIFRPVLTRSSVGLVPCLAFVAAILVSMSPTRAEDVTTPATKPAPSLDDELLRELGGNPTGGRDIDAPAKGKAASGKPGEADDPLSKIGRQMREVEKRIAKEKADDQTLDLQKEIVSNLDALIKQAQQQKKSQSKSSKAAPQSQRSKPSKSNKPGSPSGTQPSDGSAKESSDKLQNQKTEREDRPAVAGAMKESWGRLPARAREQMLESATDEFLPKYELLLEKYFKRLGEDESAAP